MVVAGSGGMPEISIDLLAQSLRERLRRPLPGADAQLGMAPAHRRELVNKIPQGKGTREAAVLMAIVNLEGPRIVLTQRRPNLKHHPGQISFPGGRREPDEELVDTALRESEEEIGLDRSMVSVLGQLSPLYVPPSRFLVHPFVGIVEGAPPLSPADDEVSRIILANLDQLCDYESRRTEKRTIRGCEVEVPYFSLDGEKIWGATAMMIAELAEALSDLRAR